MKSSRRVEENGESLLCSPGFVHRDSQHAAEKTTDVRFSVPRGKDRASICQDRLGTNTHKEHLETRGRIFVFSYHEHLLQAKCQAFVSINRHLELLFCPHPRAANRMGPCRDRDLKVGKRLPRQARDKHKTENLKTRGKCVSAPVALSAFAILTSSKWWLSSWASSISGSRCEKL